jgi:hypothetical protein
VYTDRSIRTVYSHVDLDLIEPASRLDCLPWAAISALLLNCKRVVYHFVKDGDVKSNPFHSCQPLS